MKSLYSCELVDKSLVVLSVLVLLVLEVSFEI